MGPWQLGPQSPTRLGQNPFLAELPTSGPWGPVSAGRSGLVNLNREFKSTGQPSRWTWLRKMGYSAAAQKSWFNLAGWGRLDVYERQLIT